MIEQEVEVKDYSEVNIKIKPKNYENNSNSSVDITIDLHPVVKPQMINLTINLSKSMGNDLELFDLNMDKAISNLIEYGFDLSNAELIKNKSVGNTEENLYLNVYSSIPIGYSVKCFNNPYRDLPVTIDQYYTKAEVPKFGNDNYLFLR